MSKNGLIAFLSIENSKESKSRRGAQVVLTNKKQRLCSSKLLSLQTIRQITNHYQCTLVFSFESSASYHRERKQEVQTCWNWQTLTVCYKSVCRCSTYEIATQKYVCVSSIYYHWHHIPVRLDTMCWYSPSSFYCHPT